MENFKFTPENGFRDGTTYPNPTSEANTRDMFQRPLDQLRDYINFLVNTLTSKNGLNVIGTPTGNLGKVIEEIKNNDNFTEEDANLLIGEAFGEDINATDEYTLEDSNALYKEVFGNDI